MHPRARLHGEAFCAILRIFRAWPPIRAGLVDCLCELILQHHVQEVEPLVVSSAGRLCQMVDEWRQLEDRADCDGSFHCLTEDWAGGDITGLNVRNLEAVALFLLCNVHGAVRIAGLKLLRSSRGMQQSSASRSNDSATTSTTLDILEQAAADLLKIAGIGQLRLEDDVMQSLAALDSPADQRRWSSFVGEVFGLLSTVRTPALPVLWRCVARNSNKPAS